jgi:MFS family permease
MMRSRHRTALALVLTHAVLVQVIVYAVRPTLSYAALDAGASAAFLGVISAAFAVPGLFLAMPAGRALDRFGERFLLIIGPLAILVGAAVAVVAAESILLLVVATVLIGLGHLLSLIGQQTMVANTTRPGRFDSVFGLYTFAASLGQTVGPLLLVLPGRTATTPPTQLIFVVCAALGAVMLLMTTAMKSSSRLPSGNQPGMLRTAGVLLRTHGLPQSLIATSIVLSSLDIFLAYTPALGHDRGLSAAAVSTILVVRSMFSMISRLFLGRMVAVVGRRRLLVWTIGISAVTLAGFALPLPAAWLVVLAAGYGFMIGTCQPITMSWVSELAPPGTRGLAMSMRLASNRLGQTVLPATIGSFAAATGAAGVLVATAALLVGAAVSSSAVPNVTDEPEGELLPDADLS